MMLRLSIRKQFDTHGKDYLISSSQNTKLNKISLNNVSYTTTDITLSKKMTELLSFLEQRGSVCL